MDQLSDNANIVLEQRYLLRGKDNQLLESPADMFMRVAKAIAEVEIIWGNKKDVDRFTRVFYQLMSQLIFLPNSPTLMNAGTSQQQLSACFVLPVEDSLEEIFHTLKSTAKIHQRGGGTGFNFSRIRPKGDRVDNKWDVALGPVAVIEIFDRTTEKIKQGGKRRGANMGILNIDHPDIEEFISLKSGGGKVNNFNLSIGITDQFMRAVEEDKTWKLINPRDGAITKKLPAREIWKNILKNTWICGDPGLIFLDAINAHNPLVSLSEISATNPCGEVPLFPNEACNLGSINVTKFIRKQGNKYVVDWDYLGEVVMLAVRFLDNVIEVNDYPDELIEKTTKANRKIGLGIMGWADFLIKLEIPYASNRAVQLGEKLMDFIGQKSRAASSNLGEVRGNFPNWSHSIFYPKEPMRNATRISIAPTGSISIIAGVSASIEPIYALAFERGNVLGGLILSSFHQLFLDYLVQHGLDNETVLQKVRRTGSCKEIKVLGEDIREIFKTALEIEPYWHLRHQAAFQLYTDNAVSKTINLPNAATIETVDSIYQDAWNMKLKGITMFRNNTGNLQVLNSGIEDSSSICKVCQ
ncbi:adenosylcobalamin-dependent ribonucleoside-diphosphate reductase [Echinicola shivajiensis]|uniref:adenosylcobalamin-dependent ribonucleoside-diphosphate reductase n=1 Tax=Echinicola shivajiensis TaxID=1035916 RepID=UPI001BFC8F39|nr:adenosylcobalamin-dependent ribonucleoside-diphosphate reductase [Echinicola shivajiensis]